MIATDAGILQIRELSIRLPAWADRAQAVSDFSLALRPNEILCVVGESGSGKTIMARSIMGLLPPHVHVTAGEIRFEDENLLLASAARMRAIRGRRISMIFQEPRAALNPVKTIERQIGEVLCLHSDLNARERRARILAMMKSVQLRDPQRLLKLYPHQVSGGQAQRAMIAMALIMEPSVLIADEPITSLDVTTQSQILALIRDIQSTRHMGVLFITHDFGVVAEIADRVAVMQQGRLVEFGDAKQILDASRHPYTQSLIAAVPTLVPKTRARGEGAARVLTVANLNKSYHTVQAAKQINFSIGRGEVLGLIGESGSGKSTLARCITRLIEPDAGSVVLDGVDFTRLSHSALRAHRRRIQMVFQDPFGSLDPRQTVHQLITEGPIAHGVAREEATARMRALLDVVGLDPTAAARYPHEFSGGQRQRIAIARALALEPEVLIADEPVSALDVSVQAQVLRLLAEIRDRLDVAMLFITHDLRVAAQVCDNIAVMHSGEIVEYGPVARLYAEPQHPYTRELLSAVPGRDWHPRISAGL
jgi:peptide/nickel transport system ATP-binding protein